MSEPVVAPPAPPEPPAPPAPPPVASEPEPKTVPMYNPETGVKGDIHPAEVDHMRKHGWRVAAVDEQKFPRSADQMTDADLRKAIFDAIGERPGPNTKRETLLEKYAALPR